MIQLPRQVKPLSGLPDTVAYVGVLFLLVIFVVMAGLIYTPGVLIDPPVAKDLPGVPGPTVAVAIDAVGNLFYENQLITREKLLASLKEEARKRQGNLVLIVHADRNVPYEQLVSLAVLAQQAGINQILFATRPPIHYIQQ